MRGRRQFRRAANVRPMGPRRRLQVSATPSSLQNTCDRLRLSARIAKFLFCLFCRYKYSVSYSDGLCTKEKAIKIETSRIGACIEYISSSTGSSQYQSTQTTCTAVDGSAKLPFPFPPEGWALTNRYKNLTTVNSEHTNDRTIPCSDTDGFYNTPTAVAAGCTSGSDGSTGSYQNLYNNQFYGTVYYSDKSCKVFSSTTLNVLNCSRGANLVTAGNLGSDFSFLPSPGLVALNYQYDQNTKCAGVPTSYDFQASSCSDSSIQMCSANNSLVLYSEYSTSNCTNSPYRIDTYVAASELQDDQTKYSKDTCQGTYRYVCGVAANERFGFSPASVASVSLASIVVVAVAALFGRQL